MVIGRYDDGKYLSGLLVLFPRISLKFFQGVSTSGMDDDFFKLSQKRNAIFDAAGPFVRRLDSEAFFFT